MCQGCIAKQREIERLRGIIRTLESNAVYQISIFGVIKEFNSFEEAKKEAEQFATLPKNIRPTIIKVYKEECNV